MMTLFTALVMTITMLTLSACGGGGGGGGSNSGSITPPPPVSTSSISGSVAGTTIIVVNSSGNIVATSDTAGRSPDVDTDSDGSLDAFSFQLSSIPLTENLRVYLVTGGGIYPMYFDTNNDGVSDSNVFELGSAHVGPLVLGFIDITIEDGRAIPSSSPNNAADVTSAGNIPEIPLGINEPPTSGLTIAELNTKGKNALASGWVLGAKTYFLQAADLASNSSGTDEDTARFLLALTRVAALGFDTLSDGSELDMGRVGDLLDLFGFANNEVRGNWALLEVPAPLPNDSPTGNDIRNFSYDVIRQELQAATENLDEISETFDTEFTHDGEVFNADYGDALFFSGLLNSVKASMEIQQAYNLDVDIDEIYNDELTIEDVRTRDSTLLGSPKPENLAEAKVSLSLALARLESAIDFIDGETDDQSDDLITLDETVDSAEIKTWIDQTRLSMVGAGTRIETVAVDLQKFFDGGVVFDDATLPGITGNDITGDYPEPTFGGVIIDADADEPGIQTINND